ncbi:hypothetical protein EV126DRAFT_62614 [Verticillium dahliae]|nr:hypothetical protein EV126DRAFT_62614 [Verticillium dahliae]
MYCRKPNLPFPHVDSLSPNLHCFVSLSLSLCLSCRSTPLPRARSVQVQLYTESFWFCGMAAWICFFCVIFPFVEFKSPSCLGLSWAFDHPSIRPPPTPFSGICCVRGRETSSTCPSSSLSRFLFWCVLGCCCGGSIMQKRNFPLPIPLPASVVV